MKMWTWEGPGGAVPKKKMHSWTSGKNKNLVNHPKIPTFYEDSHDILQCHDQ